MRYRPPEVRLPHQPRKEALETIWKDKHVYNPIKRSQWKGWQIDVIAEQIRKKDRTAAEES